MTSIEERNALPIGACSCGVPGCRELGWPHEWNPSLDSCSAGCPEPLDVLTAVRHGSGYAHPDCAEPPRPEVLEPLRWEGDDS